MDFQQCVKQNGKTADLSAMGHAAVLLTELPLAQSTAVV